LGCKKRGIAYDLGRNYDMDLFSFLKTFVTNIRFSKIVEKIKKIVATTILENFRVVKSEEFSK